MTKKLEMKNFDISQITKQIKFAYWHVGKKLEKKKIKTEKQEESLFDQTEQFFETASKKAIQKTAEATGVSTAKKNADKSLRTAFLCVPENISSKTGDIIFDFTAEKLLEISKEW